ncbi:MAG: signal peptidase I, partial [Candidatus Eremiobacteraeota bacterium]|nr:signal peptidase I [Candidatus Eremiobacteraeota bacterium]
MTPFQLLAIVAGIAVLRGVLSLRPVIAGTSGRSTSIAREFLDPFIVAGVAAWVLITFVARTYYIPSGSMLPTLQIHDVLLVDKFEYRFHPPKEGDIVVFPPPIPTPDDFIKRVIGRPGDTLAIQNGLVTVDNVTLPEPYVADRPAYELAIRNYG